MCHQEIGNFTRRKFKLRFCFFCGVLEIFEHFAVFRKSPQNLCIVFNQRSESPQISAILRKTCAKNAEKTLKKPARKISHQETHSPVGNFTRRTFKLRFCIFCGSLEIFEKCCCFPQISAKLVYCFQAEIRISANLRNSPQNLRDKRGTTTQKTRAQNFPGRSGNFHTGGLPS